MNSETVPNLQAPEIDISVQDPAWDEVEAVDDMHKLIHETVLKALTMAILPEKIIGKDLEVSIVLANDDLVHVLNREYRDKDKPTNVLTFASLDDEEEPITDGALNLGDVILAYETIEREAREQNKTFLEHVRHLSVHGTLHLLGYDHQDDEEATDMETLEIRILEQLGVQNPYTEDDFQL